MEIIYDLDDISAIAKRIVSLIQEYKVITFTGDLGAGKTTLINSICKVLGVKEIVSSPTFAIIQEYRANDNLIYHMDLYRLKNVQEAIDAGVEDCLLSGELCLVEWPEKAKGLFAGESISISLESLSANRRKLLVQLPQ